MKPRPKPSKYERLHELLGALGKDVIDPRRLLETDREQNLDDDDIDQYCAGAISAENPEGLTKSKRAPGFKRKPSDLYPTPSKGVPPLISIFESRGDQDLRGTVQRQRCADARAGILWPEMRLPR